MKRNTRLTELVSRAQKGDEEAIILVINRLDPKLKKYSRVLGYEDAYNDLRSWLIKAIYRYKANYSYHKALRKSV